MSESCYGIAIFTGERQDIRRLTDALRDLKDVCDKADKSCTDGRYWAWAVFANAAKRIEEAGISEADQEVYTDSVECEAEEIKVSLRCDGSTGTTYIQKVCASANLDCRWTYTQGSSDMEVTEVFDWPAIADRGWRLTSMSPDEVSVAAGGAEAEHSVSDGVQQMWLQGAHCFNKVYNEFKERSRVDSSPERDFVQHYLVGALLSCNNNVDSKNLNTLVLRAIQREFCAALTAGLALCRQRNLDSALLQRITSELSDIALYNESNVNTVLNQDHLYEFGCLLYDFGKSQGFSEMDVLGKPSENIAIWE